MENLLKNNEAKCYALLRIVTGFLFLQHGANWLFGWPVARVLSEGSWYMIYIGMPILFFGGLFTFLGFHTRWAALLSSGMMAAAYWMAYGIKAFLPPEGTTESFIQLMLPIINHGELSVMFCFAMLYIASRGSGIWSIDATLGKTD